MWLLKSKAFWLVAVIAVCMLGVWMYGQTQYGAGYSACRGDTQKQTDATIKTATEKVRADMTKALKRKEQERLNALDLAEQLRQQQDEVTPHEIIKTVEVSTCKRIDVDAMRLYNRINGSDRPGDRGDTDGP